MSSDVKGFREMGQLVSRDAYAERDQLTYWYKGFRMNEYDRVQLLFTLLTLQYLCRLSGHGTSFSCFYQLNIVGDVNSINFYSKVRKA